MALPISRETYIERFDRWQSGELIQNAFPMLNANEREFIMTGITPDMWNTMFEDMED